jgi:energy-coupling factor transporter ATP-binding protein EcfA2
MEYNLSNILLELQRANDKVNDAFSDNVLANRERVSMHAMDSLRVFVSYFCKGVYFVNNKIHEDFVSEKIEKDAIKYCRGVCSQACILYDNLNNTFMHVSINGDESVRLYFALRDLICDVQAFGDRFFSVHYLKAFDDYPEDMDETLKRFYLLVGKSFDDPDAKTLDDGIFYIEREIPIIIGGHRVLYELTMIPVGDTDNKFGRMVVFSKSKIKENYAIKSSLCLASFLFAEHRIPITLIKEWEVSIRPCELEKIGYFAGVDLTIKRRSIDYQNLMLLLKGSNYTLTDLCSCDFQDFLGFKEKIAPGTHNTPIIKLLESCRLIIRSRKVGHRTLRYLLYRTNYDVLLRVAPKAFDSVFDGTKLPTSCYAFEKLPFARSLPNHNPPLFDLLHSQPDEDYRPQRLYRYIKNRLMNEGCMYVPKTDVYSLFPDADKLIEKYNQDAFNQEETIQTRLNYFYIVNSEEDLKSIFSILRSFIGGGIPNFQIAEQKIEPLFSIPLSPDKRAIVNTMFNDARVFLIYGPAGTGKTTLLSDLSTIFKDKSSLFLSNTYSALNNIKVRVSKDGFNSDRSFLVTKQFVNNFYRCDYDVTFIDECSTISNEDFLAILKKVKTKILVLVGDTQQIEAIKFGNWFSLAQKVLPKSVQGTLSMTFRNGDESYLLKLWTDLRNEDLRKVKIDMADCHYSHPLNEAVFTKNCKDEVILALNYDGVYGVNNLNTILQAGNPGKEYLWRQRLYKIGDPIIFTATNLFSSEIYNNLKGILVNISPSENGNRITFSIKINSPGMTVGCHRGFECLSCDKNGDSIISFWRDKPNQEYFDNGGDNRYLIPFQIAYAVSIHKAQGLEYDSVKVVVTEEAGEYVTKNILYTAITRAKKRLMVFWSPEVQEKVLGKAKTKPDHNYAILKACGILDVITK